MNTQIKILIINMYHFPPEIWRKIWLSGRPSIVLHEVSTINDLPTLPQTARKQFIVLKHQSPATIRDKRTVSIPSLNYYHSQFRMNLIRRKSKKRPSPRWLQMVRSLPVEHRYKFGICPKDCRYVHCDISGKIALNKTLMFL